MEIPAHVTALMDLKELAALWRVSPHTIRAWVRQKRLAPTRICRRRRKPCCLAGYCGSPTRRSRSLNLGSERSGSSMGSIFMFVRLM